MSLFGYQTMNEGTVTRKSLVALSVSYINMRHCKYFTNITDILTG